VAIKTSRCPAIEGLRPTPDRVRQTLFDWLQHFWAGQGQDLSGMRVLDAFAGSGALGFEAASRGASHVSFLEQHPLASQMLARHIASFQAAHLQLISGHALRIMERLNRGVERFDLVLLDPPFASQLHLPAAQLAIPLLSEAVCFMSSPIRAGTSTCAWLMSQPGNCLPMPLWCSDRLRLVQCITIYCRKTQLKECVATL